MWNLRDPERWRRALQRPHVATIRMELWSEDSLVSESVPFHGGAVTDQWVTGTRRSLSTAIRPTPQWLRWLELPGLELRPFRGIRYSRAASEECPLGRFPLRRPDIDTNVDEIPIRCDDYFQRVIAAKFAGPTMGPSGYIVAGIQHMLREIGLPEARVLTMSGATTEGVLLQNGRDQAIADYAKAGSLEVYFDREGTPTITDVVKITNSPAYVGVLGSTLKSDASKVFNLVAVRSSASGVDFGTVNVAIDWEGHPASLYRLGSRKYPEWRVLNYTSGNLSNAGQALEAGRAILARVSGEAHTVEYRDVPDASRDSSDTIQGRVRTGLEKSQIVSVTTPLTVTDPQTIVSASTQLEGDE